MHGSPTAISPRGTPARRGKSPRFRADSPSQAGSSTLPSDFTNEPFTTFTSSLKILVEGSKPIDSDSEKEPEPAEQPPSTTTESKRAPRKSKTEALAALHSHARSSSPTTGENDHHNEHADNYRIPVSPKLDLSSVKTFSPRQSTAMHKEPRPFDLQDCPEFYPTVEEFKDPMAYVRSIADKAKDYGICKIIPPADWQMPFVTDTEVCGLCHEYMHDSCMLCRIFVFGLGFSASTLLRHLLEPNSIFWNSFIAIINNKAMLVLSYPP